MPSASQLAANQANAQLSTGPRTSHGKSQSSQNARTHGLTAQQLKVDPDDQPAFESLTRALRDELDPQGELESALFDRILHASWNLRKIDLLEATLLAAFDPLSDQHSISLNRLSMYRSRTERSLYKAQSELRALQEERLLRQTALDNPATYPPLVRIACIQRNWTILNRRVKRSHPLDDEDEPNRCKM